MLRALHSLCRPYFFCFSQQPCRQSCYHAYFIDKETEAQTGGVSWPRLLGLGPHSRDSKCLFAFPCRGRGSVPCSNLPQGAGNKQAGVTFQNWWERNRLGLQNLGLSYWQWIISSFQVIGLTAWVEERGFTLKSSKPTHVQRLGSNSSCAAC